MCLTSPRHQRTLLLFCLLFYHRIVQRHSNSRMCISTLPLQRQSSTHCPCSIRLSEDSGWEISFNVSFSFFFVYVLRMKWCELWEYKWKWICDHCSWTRSPRVRISFKPRKTFFWTTSQFVKLQFRLIAIVTYSFSFLRSINCNRAVFNWVP